MIKTFDYLTILESIEDEIMIAIQRTLHSGQLILGPETEAFEQELATLVGAKHCIGVTSGTTAIHLALMGLEVGPGDEVITVANTCVPTISAICLAGATPIFVDIRDEDLMIDPDLVERAITERTKCIIPVHLWGQGTEITRLKATADRAGVYLLEDCAQAHGTIIDGQHAGTFGVAGCFSFYPTKNLGAYGDAGAIITNNDALAERLKRQRVYGYSRSNYAEEPGMNARIAELQAAVLRVKLPYLENWLEQRRIIADRYLREIDNPAIQLPHLHDERQHAFHQFVIRCQDRHRVIAAFEANNIGYGIHYPTPIHQMPPYQHLGDSLPITERVSDEILSIPIYETLSEQDVDLIITTLNEVD